MKPYRIRHDPPERETMGDFLRAFAAFALLMLAMYSLALAAAAYALNEAVK